MNPQTVTETLQHVMLCLEDGSEPELCGAVGMLELAGMSLDNAISTVEWLESSLDNRELYDRLDALALISSNFQAPIYSFKSLYISPINYNGFRFMISERPGFNFYFEYKEPLGKIRSQYLHTGRQEAELEWLIKGNYLMQAVINGEM